jgi:hypothetical protein
VRHFILGLMFLCAACASSSAQTKGAIGDPSVITLQNMYWGSETSSWTVPREGEGRYVEQQRVVSFHVSAEAFDRVRELLRPYEHRAFQCRRVVTDGPYGFVIWSSGEGLEHRRTQWDAGCITGDADDLFARIDAATAILTPLRDGAPE